MWTRISAACVVLALIAAVALTALACHLSSTSEGEKLKPAGSYKLCYDAELKQVVPRIVPSVVSQGWNNQSFWLLNCGSDPFLLAMSMTLPSDCQICWSYNNSLVYPQQKIPLAISLFIGNRTAAEFSRLIISVRISTITPVK